jgi:hypothetical protein
VSRGDRDVSPFGCRQMLTNGYEWLRTLNDDSNLEIPLSDQNLFNHSARYIGCSFFQGTPPTLADLGAENGHNPAKVDDLFDVGFRVVLEE